MTNADSPLPRPAALLVFIRTALKDNDEDFTTGLIDRALGLLAIPMMLEMPMESIFAVVDIAFVSRLGTDAVAAVGSTEALITVLYGIAIGLGMGLTAMVSRALAPACCISAGTCCAAAGVSRSGQRICVSCRH